MSTLKVGQSEYRVLRARRPGRCLAPSAAGLASCGDRRIRVGDEMVLGPYGWTHPRCLLAATEQTSTPAAGSERAAQAIDQHHKDAEEARVRAARRARRESGPE